MAVEHYPLGCFHGGGSIVPSGTLYCVAVVRIDVSENLSPPSSGFLSVIWFHSWVTVESLLVGLSLEGHYIWSKNTVFCSPLFSSVPPAIYLASTSVRSSHPHSKSFQIHPRCGDTEITEGSVLRHEDVWRRGCLNPRFLDLSTSWKWVVRRIVLFIPEEISPPVRPGRRLGAPQSCVETYCDVFDRGPSLLCNRGRMVPWIRSPLGIVALHGNQQ
jgi:hypothetical protein